MASNRRIRLKVAALFIVVVFIAATVYFELIRREKAPDYIETTGVMEATEVELTSKIAGKIDWLCCVEGDPVKAGSLAVRLESGELKARVEEAKAALTQSARSLDEARVNLDNAKALEEAAKYDAQASKAEVARAKALADDARENIERATGLFKDGFISKKDFDAARTSFDANDALLRSAVAHQSGAYANLKNSTVNIKASEARISSSEARKSQAEAQLNVTLAQLKDTEIFCPMDGVTVYRSFELGEYVNPGASIYTVDDLKNIWARVDIEETVIQKVKLGDKAVVYPAGNLEKPFEGRVIEVGEVGGFATQRDVTRGRPDIKTFRVKAGIAKPDGSLKPGMTVRVRIFFDKEYDGRFDRDR